MTTVLDQAQNFSGGVVSAARKRERWLRKAANTSDPETAEQYREAAADLAARFPDIDEIPIGGAEAFARERGHGTSSRSPVHAGRARRQPATARSRRDPSLAPPKTSRTTAASAPPPASAPKASRRTSKPSRGSRRRRTSRRARPAATPRVDRAIRQTGVPQAIEGSGSALMTLLGTTVGLSFAYLVLHAAETPGSGVRALPTVFSGINRGLGRFLSPEQDVFPHGGLSEPSNEPIHTQLPGGSESSTRYEGPRTLHRASERLKALEAQQHRTQANRRNRHRHQRQGATNR